MDELQDAIEDATYVNAISGQGEGPRPMVPWIMPGEEELAEWKQMVREREAAEDKKAFSMEWTLSSALGLFLFSAFLKDKCQDHVRINFVEAVNRWRKLQGQQNNDQALQIAQTYLFENEPNSETGLLKLPAKTEIGESDLACLSSNLGIPIAELQELVEQNYDPASTKCCLAMDGPERDQVIATVEATSTSESMDSSAVIPHTALPGHLFDRVEAIILESLRKDFWTRFKRSNEYARLMMFMWYQDKKVVEDDFYVMRVLGRGGFGLVTACKKGTSGKFFALKVMNKKRLKIKKSQQLSLNERFALASVDSPFVVGLKYSFQSKDNIFLVLDLMTGGDLSYHLIEQGYFERNECLYYAGRIMLGLQALHDINLVYRDLKPENCLLAEDGRVKLTDLGLATEITPTLQGAAGTRGYWAPEMLRRDKNGKRMPYGHTVDWFSFGCVLAEFISGANPFRTEAALNFGLEQGKKTKEKAIDHATLEMNPDLESGNFDEDATDLCRKLLDKNENTRLGANGCKEIMAHPYFKDVNWEMIIKDQKLPPYEPPKDVNAASQSEIGTFAEDKTYHDTPFEPEDDEVYKYWNWTNPKAFAAEVIEFLIYERITGARLYPIPPPTPCCCAVC
eukprot:CAMPEP_0198282082 /NCGR_PEP_ID=MMETSP1449-20131203/1930_1 /TAXON_ID=420275 /ORGANISM="Attheya septentrionalis, Strain CCMP2084" /LENGTH=622 /DNA_ID=CAMNT_0043978163 /DNA_START=75 /DNA_END=1943 /DNA_ORIENTATION=+